jgi:hypothetical protein
LAHRGRIRRAEHKAFGGQGRIRLRDGSIYRYNWQREAGTLWAYCIGLLRITEDMEMPPEPEILQKIRVAKDPWAAMAPFRPENPERALIDPGLLLVEDPEELDRMLGDPVEDLSDP